MTKRNENIKLTKFDDIFKTQDEIENSGERVQDINLEELHPFRNHPFKVKDDEEMEKTVESVREYGVLTPAIARPREDGGYELISGHAIAGVNTPYSFTLSTVFSISSSSFTLKG